MLRLMIFLDNDRKSNLHMVRLFPSEDIINKLSNIIIPNNNIDDKIC